MICEIPGVQRSWCRLRCTRNVDRENNFNNDQSPARDLRVYHCFSFIVFCHDIDRSTAGCAGVMQASLPVGNGSIARPQPTLTCTWAHAGHRARQASPFSRPGRVRLSGAGPKVFRKGQWRIAVPCGDLALRIKWWIVLLDSLWRFQARMTWRENWNGAHLPHSKNGLSTRLQHQWTHYRRPAPEKSSRGMCQGRPLPQPDTGYNHGMSCQAWSFTSRSTIVLEYSR